MPPTTSQDLHDEFFSSTDSLAKFCEKHGIECVVLAAGPGILGSSVHFNPELDNFNHAPTLLSVARVHPVDRFLRLAKSAFGIDWKPVYPAVSPDDNL